MSDIDGLDHFQRLTAGVAAKVRGDDTYTPPARTIIQVDPKLVDPTRIVHIELPFWDVLILVFQVQLSLLVIALPFVIGYLYWA